ncbi:MAG: Holliday junction resolvase RuvX [Lachnospiraceae bacterium]|nr:Holliday junction resolvase RuvX [Lachnospiraceae bacterium]
MGEIKERILGLDFGSKTVGVAVSDPVISEPSCVETIWRDRPGMLKATVRRVIELADEYKVGLIVVGYPLSMSGEVSDRCRQTDAFISMLVNKIGIPIVRVDERLSTFEADDILKERGIRKENRKAVIDQIAACIIIKDYLNNKDRYDRDGKDQIF